MEREYSHYWWDSRSDLTCGGGGGGGGGAASSYLVQPTSTGLLDGNSLKKASRDGYTCCVPGCYNNTKKNRLYKFPREKVTRDKWIKGVCIHWTGLLDWTTGLDYWTGLLD